MFHSENISSIVCIDSYFYGICCTMFINQVPNNAELTAIIVNELRDLYGIKFRKEKKVKHQQVCSYFFSELYFEQSNSMRIYFVQKEFFLKCDVFVANYLKSQ